MPPVRTITKHNEQPVLSMMHTLGMLFSFPALLKGWLGRLRMSLIQCNKQQMNNEDFQWCHVIMCYNINTVIDLGLSRYSWFLQHFDHNLVIFFRQLQLPDYYIECDRKNEICQLYHDSRRLSISFAAMLHSGSSPSITAQCSLVTTRVAKHRGVGSLCHARSASEEHLIVGNTWNQKIYPPLYATSIDDCILRIIIYLRFGAIGPASPFKKEEYYVASCGPVLPTL